MKYIVRIDGVDCSDPVSYTEAVKLLTKSGGQLVPMHCSTFTVKKYGIVVFAYIVPVTPTGRLKPREDVKYGRVQ